MTTAKDREVDEMLARPLREAPEEWREHYMCNAVVIQLSDGPIVYPDQSCFSEDCPCTRSEYRAPEA